MNDFYTLFRTVILTQIVVSSNSQLLSWFITAIVRYSFKNLKFHYNVEGLSAFYIIISQIIANKNYDL